MPDMGQIGTQVLSTLSGGATQPSYSYDDSGALQTQQVPQKPGQMFKGMLAGMLSGLAGGVQANAQGMHGGLGAFAGGFEANSQRLQSQDQRKRQQAQQTFQNQQEAKRVAMERSRLSIDQDDLTLRKAQDARAQQRLLQDIQTSKLQNDEIAQRIATGKLTQQSAEMNVHTQAYQLDELMQENWNTARNFGKRVGDHEFSSWTEAMASVKKGTLQPGVDLKPVLNPATNKYELYTMPATKQVITSKIPGGGSFTQLMDGNAILAHFQQLKQWELDNAEKQSVIARNYGELQEQKDKLAEKNETVAALKDLDSVGNDLDKLKPSSKVTLNTYFGKVASEAAKSLDAYTKSYALTHDGAAPPADDPNIKEFTDELTEASTNRLKLRGRTVPVPAPGGGGIAGDFQKMKAQGKTRAQVLAMIDGAQPSPEQRKAAMDALNSVYGKIDPTDPTYPVQIQP